MTELSFAVATRNSMLDDLIVDLDAGTAAVIQIYSGTRPTNADTALSGNTLLATMTYSSTSYGAASAGVITANAISDDVSADDTGTAAWARISTQDVGTSIFDCDVGTSAAVIILNTVSIVAGGTVSVTASTITFGANLP